MKHAMHIISLYDLKYGNPVHTFPVKTQGSLSLCPSVDTNSFESVNFEI